ncbi:odorant-binding protein 2b [Carlito syrichta]|uniref:Odorant-binding protein 2b n=1 Tax=Carlito syrichta TaxID=1868482 RepID=A0A1U7T455_CARSF|nr:odorant-binding protein 2b [Carlito syrichta]
MKTLVLTLVLGLVTALSFALEEEEDATGTWYVDAVAIDDNLPLVQRPKKVFPVIVKAVEGGDMEVTVTFLKNNQCLLKIFLIERTEDPEKYLSYKERKVVHIQKLRVPGFCIFYCEYQRHGRRLHIAKLMDGWWLSPCGICSLHGHAVILTSAHLATSPTGRDPNVNPEALEEFKEFTRSKGFQEEDISIPLQMGLPVTPVSPESPHGDAKDLL